MKRAVKPTESDNITRALIAHFFLERCNTLSQSVSEKQDKHRRFISLVSKRWLTLYYTYKLSSWFKSQMRARFVRVSM